MTAPTVTRNRDVQAGRPVLNGTRMPTDSVWHFYERGGSGAVRTAYPHLTDAQIDTAIRYERHWWRRLERWARGALLDWLIERLEGLR